MGEETGISSDFIPAEFSGVFGVPTGADHLRTVSGVLGVDGADES